jgi:hypothetical protein
MEQLDSEKLSALLDLLVESGVEEFEGFGFHVRFTAAMFAKENQVPREQAPVEIPGVRDTARNLWEMPELWPGGEPIK